MLPQEYRNSSRRCCINMSVTEILIFFQVLKVEFWPILRETFAYMISIIALVIVLADNKVMWYEAVTLIIIYFMYLMSKYFNLL